MNRHLLKVEGSVEAYLPLLQAASAAGQRVGWLELDAQPGVAQPLPASLETAAAAGALRAVAVGAGRSVVVKPMRGEAVLRDLLREHFRGCALVLIRGELDAPRLEVGGEEEWTILTSTGAYRRSVEALLDDLRKPRPWGEVGFGGQPKND